jgi:tetratricopeptide (TPR) repeat protein/capsular polysaccharide biosynthesis protein
LTGQPSDDYCAAAFAQYQLKQYHEAFALCEQRLAGDPQDAAAWQLKGTILDALGRSDEAVVAYEQAIAQNPEQAESYAQLGELLDRAGDQQQAIKFYSRAVQLRPAWQPLRYNLARAYLQVHQYQAAVEQYHVALQLNPKDAKSHNDLGTLYSDWGQLKLAQSHYEQAIAIAPHTLPPHQNLAILWIKQRVFDRALHELKLALEVCETTPLLHFLKARCEREQKQLEHALVSMLRAIQLAPHDGQFQVELGHIFDGLKQPEAALICFQRAIELEPHHLDNYGYCAQMAIRSQQVDLALGYFRQILAHLGSSPWVQTLTQAQHSATDVYEVAFQARHTFLQQLMMDASLADDRTALSELYRCWGDVRFQLEAYFQAQAYFEAAIAVDANNVQALQNLTTAQLAQEREHEHQQLTAAPQIPERLIVKARSWLKHYPGGSYHPLHESEAETSRVLKLQYACQGLNCQPCFNRLHEAFSPVKLDTAHYHLTYPSESRPWDVERDEFTAVIPQGRSWVMPQTSWWQVCEAIATITPDNALLADLSREYPGELPGCPYTVQKQWEHRIFRLPQLPPVETIEGTVVTLTGLSANVYFHWLIDILPRLNTVWRSEVSRYPIDFVYINSKSKPFQRQTLELLGIPLGRVIESDHHPHIQATTLISPSFVSEVGMVTPQTIEFLRAQFLTPDPGQSSRLFSTYPDRLYISRGSARYRRVINEAELIDRLKRQGFTVLALEDYSIVEQIQFFHHAQAIVAPHGAGLTNLVFCQPQTTVIELFSPSYIRHYYWPIGSYLKLNFYYLVGESLPSAPFRKLMYPDSLTEDFWVDLHQLDKMLHFANLA